MSQGSSFLIRKSSEDLSNFIVSLVNESSVALYRVQENVIKKVKIVVKEKILFLIKVKLRLARWGSRNNNFFGIVAAPNKFARDGRHLERLGSYNPHPYSEPNFSSSEQNLESKKNISVKHLELNVERIKYWLGVGAQPSSRVAWLLAKAGLMPKTPMQLQKEGLNSFVDKKQWDIQVSDKEGNRLGVLSSEEARKVFVDENGKLAAGIPEEFNFIKEQRIVEDLADFNLEGKVKGKLTPPQKRKLLKSMLKI
ncbi:hypothetical protein HDU92_000494 [Lobulomyces angularis]|nr:hypothetical protein HDU92_000494 [Lobulomyces angularis]